MSGRSMKHRTAYPNTRSATFAGSAWAPFALALFVIVSACVAPVATENVVERGSAAVTVRPKGDVISAFVRRIHEDRRGHMWLGTNGDGVAPRTGEVLEYYSVREGFSGIAVRAIVEGADGNVWFGTGGGLTKYDGVSFTNYTVRDGLVCDDVWCLAFDHRGRLWVGTLEGLCRLDGDRFTAFVLPEAEPDPWVGVTSSRMVRSIAEDRAGRMWFGTNGGAYVYDGKSLRNYNEADGLVNNNVNCILEDRNGRFWFATQHKGVCYLEGDKFTAVSEAQGVQGTEVWDLFMDRAGDVWFPVENSGIYRFSGGSFRRYHETEGLTSNAVQCTYQDRDGRLWFGGYGGLFRLDGERIVYVTTGGPWR